jgi:hypothetical protein
MNWEGHMLELSESGVYLMACDVWNSRLGSSSAEFARTGYIIWCTPKGVLLVSDRLEYIAQ